MAGIALSMHGSMRKNPLHLLRSVATALLFCTAVAPLAQAKIVNVTWDELPPLPPSAGQTKQPGVAGPFAGVHGDAFLVAGGANFPEKMPWEGGAKAWWDDIWVLEKTLIASGGGALGWVSDQHFKLPRPLGYGVSVSTPEGVICAGGNDAERCYADVFLLSWDARAREIRRTPLPPMPEPLAMMAGALVGQTLYVAGGQHVMKGAVPSSVFWALDLSKRERPADFKWDVLPSWPGPARIVPVAAAQRVGPGDSEQFFLFSGRAPKAGQRTELLTDAYAFDPKTRVWRTLPKIGGGAGVSVMAGTAAAAGDNEILLFGGDHGELFRELEAHDLVIEGLRTKLGSAGADGGSRAAIEREISERLAAKKKIYAAHSGFGREVFAYDTRRDTWRVAAQATLPPQVTTVAVRWGDAIVIPSGEVRPGVRTPSIVRAMPSLR